MNAPRCAVPVVSLQLLLMMMMMTADLFEAQDMRMSAKSPHQGTCATKTCLAQPDWNPRWSLPVAWGWRQWHSPKTQCSLSKPRQLQSCLAGVATQTQCRLPPLWCLVRQGRWGHGFVVASQSPHQAHGAATHGCFTLILNQLRGRYDAAVHGSHRVNCSSRCYCCHHGISLLQAPHNRRWSIDGQARHVHVQHCQEGIRDAVSCHLCRTQRSSPPHTVGAATSMT